LTQRNARCAYPLFRQSWAADYNDPQNWFGNLFVTGAPSSGSCYANTAFDRLVASGQYEEAGRVLVDSSVYGALLYGVQQYLVQPWVRGAGGNALYDNSWTSVRILAH
jgi:ABC-type oligopeptide transport system substrate-binding subunit